jgi:nucleotide-binding universal stress UspA family protein
MSRIKRLLVPTDFSPASEIALQYAIDLAPPGASIHVLHVVDDTGLAASYPDGLDVDIPAVRRQLVADAESRLEAEVHKVWAPHTVLTTEVLAGRPIGVIVQTAKARHADLIVMGTHGRSGFAHLMLGSVTERVLRTAHCPVLAVRDNSQAADALAEELVTNRQTVHA